MNFLDRILDFLATKTFWGIIFILVAICLAFFIPDIVTRPRVSLRLELVRWTLLSVFSMTIGITLIRKK